jgi:UDP-N-acetyl-D-mannosaminuronate dehydrogenase
MKIGIVGMGEIGSSLTKVYEENEFACHCYDPFLEFVDDLSECDILNICIPYTKNFVVVVQKYIDDFNPSLTIVHSTVAPHTTKQLKGRVCHSPVRGLHPNLTEGIKTFEKYIGSEDVEVALEYGKHLVKMGIACYVCKNSVSSELAKLFDTSYYGVCIAFHAEAAKICEQEGVDFGDVMTNYNNGYNEGYSKLGLEKYTRPVLYSTEKIGGHCVVPNAEILCEYYDAKFLESILKFK